MVGLGASGDFCRDVEKVVHGLEIRHAPVLAVVHEGMISDEGCRAEAACRATSLYTVFNRAIGR